MKTFVYGIIVGAVAAWLVATQGATVDALLGSALSWRNSARGSVGGYGGPGSGR